MINPNASIYNKLVALQRKYRNYFRSHHINIFSIIFINRQTAGINIIGDDIPPDLKYEIENIFYVQ